MLPRDRHPQDDLLIVIALARYSSEFEEIEPANAARAWTMAVEFAHQHGLEPTEAVQQLQIR